MLTIYHNPRCSKSRQTLALIEEHGQTPEIVRYLETPPSPAQIKTLLKQLNMTPRSLLRKGEEAYKTLNLAAEHWSDDELIQAMHDHPKLIERPVVTKGSRAIIGRPPENVLNLLD